MQDYHYFAARKHVAWLPPYIRKAATLPSALKGQRVVFQHKSLRAIGTIVTLFVYCFSASKIMVFPSPNPEGWSQRTVRWSRLRSSLSVHFYGSSEYSRAHTERREARHHVLSPTPKGRRWQYPLSHSVNSVHEK